MPWKTALHSVSYAGLLGQATLPLEACVDKAAALGFDAVMLMAKRPHLSPLDADADRIRSLRERLQQRRLAVACLAGYNDFALRSDAVGTPFGEMQLLYVRELCRLARELECPLVRLFTGFPLGGAFQESDWQSCVRSLREAAQIAAECGVTIGVQNHHDLACHYASLLDLLAEVNAPNCRLIFDAWAAALHGDDVAAAAAELGPRMVHTTVADYVRRPQFRYEPQLVNYVTAPAAVRAVPLGEGFIDYAGFFRALRQTGYNGYIAYEMCSPLQGGGAEANLDRYARRFLEYLRDL
jgi:sugar phosphate isomerase/epimerase